MWSLDAVEPIANFALRRRSKACAVPRMLAIKSRIPGDCCCDNPSMITHSNPSNPLLRLNQAWLVVCSSEERAQDDRPSYSAS